MIFAYILVIPRIQELEQEALLPEENEPVSLINHPPPQLTIQAEPQSPPEVPLSPEANIF